MHRALIVIANAFLLIVILVGFPTITTKRVAGLNFSSPDKWQMLTLLGFGVGAGANVLCGFFTGSKTRSLYWKCACAHAAGFAICLLAFRGHIGFDWLRNFLLWLKRVTT